jgi:hypothetical protein
MVPMRTPLRLAVLLLTTLPAAALDVSIREYRSDDTLLTMAPFRFDKNRVLNLSVGIGSGAFRHPDDPPNVIWTVGDRGPNLTCSEVKPVVGIDLAVCRDHKGARVYFAPSYAPSIYRVQLQEDGHFRITDVIALKDRDGRPLNGLPNPRRTGTTEIAFDGRGRPLEQDVHGIDAEGLVRLTDGTFWVADENGPSLLNFTADGRLIARHVPQGTESDYEGARYDVIGSLPAILARRQLNRGIESVAVSPDERFLYIMLQGPLANPDINAFRASRHVRLFRIERTSMQIAGEFVYELDDPKSFRRDPSANPYNPRVSELLAIGLDRLVVLERTDLTTKLYEIDLSQATDISGSRWDDPLTMPSLELVDLREAKIEPARKRLLFDSADFPLVAGKTEGMALLDENELALINDDDFGIGGAKTQIVVVRGLNLKPQ